MTSRCLSGGTLDQSLCGSAAVSGVGKVERVCDLSVRRDDRSGLRGVYSSDGGHGVHKRADTVASQVLKLVRLHSSVSEINHQIINQWTDSLRHTVELF